MQAPEPSIRKSVTFRSELQGCVRTFTDRQSADAYAQPLHEEQAAQIANQPPSKAQAQRDLAKISTMWKVDCCLQNRAQLFRFQSCCRE
jgi:hypothetical protein